MAKDVYGYPCESRRIDEMTWYYEQREGLQLFMELFEGARTAQVNISWRRLGAAVDRHRKIKATKRAKRKR